MANNRSKGVRRHWLRAGLLALLILALGHVYYWYWPRSRAGIPSPDSPVAGLVFDDQGPEVRFWVPFPHQNLAAAERRLGSLDSVQLAVEELLGAQPLAMPSFGPFRLPPAREIAIATDVEGENFVAMAQVYPLASRLFRIAGWLADNPWMSGGEVVLGGRSVEVEWRGSLWLATTKDTAPRTVVSVVEVAPCLALIRLGERLGPVSSGLFRFSVDDRRWLLSSSMQGDSDALADHDVRRLVGVPLYWTSIQGEGEAREVRTLMALSQAKMDNPSLPALMVAQRGGAEAMRLPGERILEVVGATVYRRTVERWQLSAYDESSLDFGEQAVEKLEAQYRDSEAGIDVAVGFLDIGAARQIILEVGHALQQVPVIGDAEARRWLTLAGVLEQLDVDSQMSVLLADPDLVAIEIAPKSYN